MRWDEAAVVDVRAEVPAEIDVEEQAVRAVHSTACVPVLWQGVAALSVRQRRALLLHLEAEALLLFVRHDCCSLTDLAKAVEMSITEFSTCLQHLPLPDRWIAHCHGSTARQVIDHRKKARQRLEKWLKSWLVE
jgi:hypothetical protein